MDPYTLGRLIPVIGVVAMGSVPLAIIWVVQHFKFKRLELEAELEARRMLGERDKAQLEARIERLESVILGLRAPPAEDPQRGPAIAQPAQALPQRGLYEGPPSEVAIAVVPKREPTR